VFLPVVPYEPVRQPREQPVVEDLGGHGEKVLVVEDEEGVRLLLEKMLTRSGYRVLAAADAGKGLELYRKENGAIDLVFSDVVLPGENGLQLVERLLADDPSLPVLLASGYHEDEYRRVIEEKGYRFLQKPYSLPEVMAAVRDLLSMKEA
jgi:two-component system cell cycle sensor histidine kinase/response regulator CckA